MIEQIRPVLSENIEFEKGEQSILKARFPLFGRPISTLVQRSEADEMLNYLKVKTVDWVEKIQLLLKENAFDRQKNQTFFDILQSSILQSIFKHSAIKCSSWEVCVISKQEDHASVRISCSKFYEKLFPRKHYLIIVILNIIVIIKIKTRLFRNFLSNWSRTKLKSKCSAMSESFTIDKFYEQKSFNTEAKWSFEHIDITAQKTFENFRKTTPSNF